MSQIGPSRSVSQMDSVQKPGLGLPWIRHPLSQMRGPPGDMDVCGVSRSGERPSSQPSHGRPLSNEKGYLTRKSISAAGHNCHQCVNRHSVPTLPCFDAIPEGVEVVYGDSRKTRLPVFGNRAEIVTSQQARHRSMSSRMSKASMLSTQTRLEIDELEAKLQQCVKQDCFEIKKQFKNNDPEGKGNVSREGLQRILVRLLNRPIGHSQFQRLTDRLGLKTPVINFSKFLSSLQPCEDYENRQWVDPVSRLDKSLAQVISAEEVHKALKEKAKQKLLQFTDLSPEESSRRGNKFTKSDFQKMLICMQLFTNKSELDKLWKKYDPDSIGTISGEEFINHLGITFRDKSTRSLDGASITERKGTPRKKELERKRSIDIEKWLKDKFREGFISMKEMFKEEDPDRKGLVTFDCFLAILAKFGLKLEKPLLGAFLSRCRVKPQHQGVPYYDFLHHFHDRSEEGLAHKVLTNPKHKFHRDASASPDAQSTLSFLESKLLTMFQRDFLALLGLFKNIDKMNRHIISQEEFRAALESQFQLEFTDHQFEALLDRIPLDEDGNVKYAEFMKQFDAKGRAPSLFESMAEQRLPAAGLKKVLPRPPKQSESGPISRLGKMSGEEESRRATTKEIFYIIKNLLNDEYRIVEETFRDLDERNTGRLTQEMMYQLLKKFNITPGVTRGDIRTLWKTLITNAHNTLDFHEFVRHFGFSPKSASFPNAKICPPVRGDADFMMRSNKLNCATDMLHDGLRAKIDYMWEDLSKVFLEMDPYRTGFVSEEEFKDVLIDLCYFLSDYELEMLTRKFAVNNHDRRVSYVEFLKPFVMRRRQNHQVNYDALGLLQKDLIADSFDVTAIVDNKDLSGLTLKLKKKLSGNWKNLRQAFRKLDSHNEGFLSLLEFRSVLKLANVALNDEELYQVMNKFDEKMTGRIPYEKFINETFRSNSKQKTLAGLKKSSFKII